MGISFDRAAVTNNLERMGKIPDDAKPLWGTMSSGQMRAHLQTALRYSLGKEEVPPDKSKFLIRAIVVPLLLSGLIKIPRGSSKSAMYDAAAPTASLEEVKAELEEFLSRKDTGGLNPPAHPALGDLGPNKWGKLHVIHFDHHLRQFGV
ncbi:MAG: hypothetical protein COA73_07210 [Candidatus Hydrogenedentota bacterium]|nr:MAG: hypothetical protein COA73_07210 [Candidatus Hydrogenedentota bacterium]